jgi:hypothetical protein
MNGGGKTSWKKVQVHGSGRGELRAEERLAALYRFQNREPQADLCFIDAPRDARVADPAEIDWSSFPLIHALEAVTHEELRLLRSLLEGARPRGGAEHDEAASGCC